MIDQKQSATTTARHSKRLSHSGPSNQIKQKAKTGKASQKTREEALLCPILSNSQSQGELPEKRTSLGLPMCDALTATSTTIEEICSQSSGSPRIPISRAQKTMAKQQ